MGPFPHDAPPATISDENPMGTDGFEFVEFAHPEPARLGALFELMGFSAVCKAPLEKCHALPAGRRQLRTQRRAATVSPPVSPSSHGPSACAMGFRVVDAAHAYQRAQSRLAPSPFPARSGRWSLTFPPSRELAARSSILSTAMARRARSGMSISAGRARASPRLREPALTTSII